MLKEVIIHVGMHKTGTTSIQRTFHKFDDGKTFYANWITPNHSLPAKIGFSNDYLNLPHLINEGKSSADISALRIKYRAQLEKELSRTSRERMVICGEEIGFIEKEGLADFRSFLAKHSEKQTIVIYLREPLSYAASALQQRTSSGLTDVKLIRNPSYKARLQRFCNVFGKANVTAKEFNKDVLLNGDVISDFAGFLGVAHPKPGFKNQNESISLEAMKLMVIFSRHCQVLNGDQLTFQAMETFRALIANAFAGGQKIDKNSFLAMADFSGVEYVKEQFGIDFAPPEGLKVGSLEDLNRWLGDTRGMDLSPLDALLTERGIQGNFATPGRKLVRLYYSCLIGEHETEKKARPASSFLKDKIRRMMYSSQFLEKNARRVHRKVTTFTGRSR